MTVGGHLHGIYSEFTVILEGWATWNQEPVARPGMFWDPNVWAGLCPDDAGDAEEELLVKQSTSLWVGLPSLFELAANWLVG